MSTVRCSILLLFVGVVCGCSYHNMDAGCSFKQQDRWNYLMFVQTWPGTFCDDGCCRKPTDVTEVPEGFTIHGLWPQYKDNSYPTCCSTVYNYTYVSDLIEADANLAASMDMYWPSLKNCEFIQYEYEKHGTCATAYLYDGPLGPSNYFSVAINLRKKYDILQILADAEIYPSSESHPVYYSTYEIVYAINNALDIRAFIDCSSDTSLIDEVKICVSYDESNPLYPALMDCPDDLISSESNCYNSKGVRIPEFPVLTQSGCPH